VNINKLYQPWRSFAAIINKCLTGKSSGYDNLRLSQAQILWGLYHKRNVDYAYLIWEDFVYQVEHKNQKKSNEMYYPRFAKVIIHHFMSKDPSILRRNKFGAMLPIELTNDEIRNSNAYKEYYAIATGEAAPKPKASVRRTRSSSDTSITPPTVAASPRLTVSAKGKQTAKATKAKSLSAFFEVSMTKAQQLKLVTKRSMQQTYISQPSSLGADEGSGSKPGVPDVPTDESEEELSWNSTDDKGDEEEFDEEETDDETRDEESFDPIPQTPESSEDEGDSEEDQGLNIGEEERHVEEEKKDELYRDQESSSVSSQFVTSMLNPTLDVGMESIFRTTSQMDVQTPTFVAPLPITAPTMTSSTIATTTTTNFSEVIQTNQFVGAVSAIFEIVQQYMDQRMNEAVKVTVQIQSGRLRDEAQRENDEFLRTVDENIKKVIKEQVKDKVKVQVSKILPRIKQAVNEQLEAKVLTRSSHSSRTSYTIAGDLSEMELKKILIEKIEGNKSIQRSDEQRNLYKALVEAYESDKIILDAYGETVTLKRRRDDDVDKDKEPSTGPDRGSKRRREGKEPESASAPSKTATRSAGRSTKGSRSRQVSASESALAEEPQQKPPTPDRDWNKTLPAVHVSIQSWISELAKQADSRSSFNELMDTPLDFSNFLMNRLRVDTLTSELLAGPTYELMKGPYKSLIELEYHLEEVYKATIDQLDWVNPEGQQYPHNLLQPLPLIPDNRVEERFAFNVSLRMFTRSNVIQRRVKDLQLCVESYQNRLNLTNWIRTDQI
nr:monodehydroascorbate reductase [Tanacetum cinerariifolium]